MKSFLLLTGSLCSLILILIAFNSGSVEGSGNLQTVRNTQKLSATESDSQSFTPMATSFPKESPKFIPHKRNSQGALHPPVYDSFIEGVSTKEITRNFVKLNCSNAVYEVFDEAYDYAESKKVSGSFIFAVAWADTSCGKALSTPNNPGNVGNNDRGNRVGFFTMSEGFRALTNALTNKYLGGNTEVWQFSGGGRARHGSKNTCKSAPAPFKCYATSGENWDTNVMRAFEAMGIKDENIKL